VVTVNKNNELQGWQHFCLVSSSLTMVLLWYRN